MADDFMDLLSGKDEDTGATGGQDAKGMEDLLGSLLGGGGGAQGGLGDLLGGLMGGGGQPAAGQGDMGDLLGGLMGGSGGSAGAAGAGGLGALLGGLMGGGGGQSGAGGLGGLLGGLLGGGGGDPMSFGGGGGGMSLPFAGTLAEKLGISEQMANMLIMGAIGLLTSSMAKNRSSGRGGQVDLNLVSDPDYIRSSGVAWRLSSQMGISEDDAILGLQQTMSLMAAGGAPAAPKKVTAKKKMAKKTSPTAAQSTAKPKKSTAKKTKTAPKKKSTKKESGSDFMDLLDDPNV